MGTFVAFTVLLLAMTVEISKVIVPGFTGRVTLAVDGVIALIGAIAILKITFDRSWKLIPGKYILALLGFVYVVIAGIILNDVSMDTATAGVRLLFRYIPVFLLPFAFNFDEKQTRRLLMLCLVILLLQVPLTLVQRLVLQEGVITGDYIVGSLGTSSALAILCCIACGYVLSAFFRKKLGPGVTGLLILLLLIPPSLAETKVTPILLLLAAVILLWIYRKQLDATRILFSGAALTVALSGFVFLYSVLYSPEEGVGYFEMMTDSRWQYSYRGIEAPKLDFDSRSQSFLISKLEANQIAAIKEGTYVGRMDALQMPFASLWPSEWLRLSLGLGIGNVSTNFGAGGKYFYLHERLDAAGLALGQLIWETGVAGAFFVLLFFALLAKDLYRLAGAGGTATFAAPVFVGVCITVLCLAYCNVFLETAFGVPVFFFSSAAIAAMRRNEAPQSRDFALPGLSPA